MQIDKIRVYDALVEQRRSCRECADDYAVSLGACHPEEFDTDHIGPFTDWQGNLNAELMIVGREWGGVETYKDQQGTDKDTDPTNANLVQLINSIAPALGYDKLLPPSACQKHEPRFKGPHYFTNSMLCLKHGGMTRSSKQPMPRAFCYSRCTSKFLTKQIELIQPLVVVTLGEDAYRATMLAFGKAPIKGGMSAIFRSGPVELSQRTMLVPVYHTGYWGWLARRSVDGRNRQFEDWQMVAKTLQHAREREALNHT